MSFVAYLQNYKSLKLRNAAVIVTIIIDLLACALLRFVEIICKYVKIWVDI